MIDYNIKEADIKSDKKKIISFLNNNMEEYPYSEEYYKWRFEDVIFSKAQCWTIQDKKSNNIVGFSSIFPRKVIIKGNPTNVSALGDFYVDKKYRFLSPSIKLQRSIIKELNKTDFQYIYGVPNELANVVLKRVGYKRLGGFKQFVKPLKISSLSKEYSPFFLKINIFKKIISPLIKFFSRENRYVKKFEYIIETSDSFDERYDSFWQNISGEFNIIEERNSTFLNWRYTQNPLKKYKIFSILKDKNSILGYIVYFSIDNIYYIVDILFIPKEKILNALLSEFFIYSRRKGIGGIIVRYYGNDLFEKKLKEFNFFTRKKSEVPIIVYKNNKSLEDSYLFNKKNWHFLMGDKV